MKAFLRWIAGPLVRFIVRDSKVHGHVRHFCGTSAGGDCVTGVIDPFGIWYLKLHTPEEMREYAWRLIGMATALEAEKEFQT